MTMRGWGPALFLVLAPACQSNSGVSPSLPAAPAPPAPEPPPEEIRLVPTGFGGPLFQPNDTLRHAPGTVLHLPVMTAANDFTNDGRTSGLSILVRTDAPSTALSVSPQVWVGGRADPGLVEVQVLEGASSSEPPAVFRIWLEEDPTVRWAPGWGLALDTTPLRVAAAKPTAMPPPCERLELKGQLRRGVRDGGSRAALTFGAIADDFRAGEITLRSDHPAASLTLLAPYQMPYADLDPESDRARVQFHLYPTTFAFGFGLRETPGGFEQTMSLGWFHELHLRAQAPGCDPVELSCDDTGQCSSRGSAP